MKTYRYFTVVLYPDDPKINNQFDILNQFYLYVYILHDKDKHEDGSFKKPHYHVILSLPNNSPTNCDSIKDRLQLDYVEGVRSIRSACRYLVHADDPDKVQYERFNLSGSPYMVAKAKSYLASDLNSSMGEVIQLINSVDAPLTYTAFLSLCVDNGLAPVTRSLKVGYLLNEHNSKFGVNSNYV